jgi:hypothetical protein
VHESWEKKIKERKEKSDVLADLCEKEMKKKMRKMNSSNVFD